MLIDYATKHTDHVKRMHTMQVMCYQHTMFLVGEICRHGVFRFHQQRDASGLCRWRYHSDLVRSGLQIIGISRLAAHNGVINE